MWYDSVLCVHMLANLLIERNTINRKKRRSAGCFCDSCTRFLVTGGGVSWIAHKPIIMTLCVNLFHHYNGRGGGARRLNHLYYAAVVRCSGRVPYGLLAFKGEKCSSKDMK